ncbi:unnamed protein product [Owenia fusiformis]|uniref:Caveolin n=1 Tax=Owenia fusiformis TaxID=6347 RepID=A0A8J1Y8Y5_OWEFU|nr:unnamed protein product [Owenia fusiformis]
MSRSPLPYDISDYSQDPVDYPGGRRPTLDRAIYNPGFNPQSMLVTGNEVREQPEIHSPKAIVKTKPTKPEKEDKTKVKTRKVKDDFTYTEHIDIDFESMFFEPDKPKMLAPISCCFEILYNVGLYGVYNLLSIVFGIFLSLGCGMLFGLCSCCTVWCLQPFVRMFLMLIRIMQIFYKAVVGCCCDPCYNSLSLVCSRINGSFGLNVSGINIGQNSIERV